MASTSYPHGASSTALPAPGAGYHAPGASSGAPAGTFLPGTKVQVGQHRVIIEKYLSEGGFAHVYVVKVPRDGGKTEVAVLKRVAVPDKEALANMRTEVETMKKLKGHKHIVTYIDSHASQLKGGGYEVFLLMEYCNGGGLIDFMNTRLQHRLTEPEILHIFSDVAEGVACMHYLKPPLLHRDLKVENVLIATRGSAKIYKLCDFGSAAQPRPAASNAAEGRLIEDDVQRHTTLQYRSPEMIDVYRKQPIDEKSDIWALGVLLYKLCYYTTPFEEQGQMAILNASFKFPSYPAFSDRLKKFITSMLRENPQLRPNIYQVLREVCSIRGTEVPIKDIYANRSRSETRSYQQLPPPSPDKASPPVIGIQKVTDVQPAKSNIPDIAPMRRGRPTAVGQTLQPSGKGTPAGSRGTSTDPFAALDSADVKVRSAAVDELTAKFPSLEEFSLLHDRGAKFEFGQSTPADSKQGALQKRVTEALADEAFGQPIQTVKSRTESAPVEKASSTVTRTASVKKSKPIEPLKQPANRSQPALIHQPSPKHPAMISTGVGASPPISPRVLKQGHLDRPIWRVPQATAPTVHLTALDGPSVRDPSPELPPRPENTSKAGLLQRHRTKSQTLVTSNLPKSPASSRPSLEGSRPSALDINDPINRSKSANARPRPSSVYIDSTVDYLRDRESPRGGRFSATYPPKQTSAIDDSSDEDGPVNLSSNIAFLQSMEGGSGSAMRDAMQAHKSRRSSSGNKKRSSLQGMVSNTKNLLGGRFGDAFRRFEANSNEPRAPSPGLDDSPLRTRALTPIAGSEATGTSGRSDDEAIDETEDLSPELRRELERRRLSEEEKRVAAAAAEYRQRIAGGGGAPVGRSSTIASRIQNLKDDSNKPPPPKTAEGYGRFTDASKPADRPAPLIARKPVAVASIAKTSTVPVSASAPPVAQRTGPRPSVAPKPVALRTGGPNTVDSAPGPDDDEDLETSFAKKFPGLADLEMEDMDIAGPGRTVASSYRASVRDV